MENNINYYQPNDVELLGYAYNAIHEVKSLVPNLPNEYSTELKIAVALIHDVYEYLLSPYRFE